MASSSDNNNNNNLPFWLDPGTKGGAVFLSLVLFVVPIVAYNLLLTVFPETDSLQLGINIGVGFTVLALVGWMGTYIFRVATKDMTYVSTMENNGAFGRNNVADAQLTAAISVIFIFIGPTIEGLRKRRHCQTPRRIG